MTTERKKILITGAAGMIGSHLVDHLLSQGEKYQVIGIDDMSIGHDRNLIQWRNHHAFSLHKVDVREAKRLTELAMGCSVLVHLAAKKKIGESQNGVDVLRVNSDGTEAALEVAKECGCKFVLGSTSDCYGTSTAIPFREDGDLVLGPSNVKRWAYAVSKLFDEQLAFAYHKDYGVPVVVLRYFGAFSERSSFTWSGGHVPVFIDAVLRDREIDVHGDGSQTRSMGYVFDQVEGTALAMESDAAVGEIINIGNDEEMSVLESARLIHELCATGKPLRINYIPMTTIFGNYTDIKRRVPDLSKAKQLFGYVPRWSMRSALAHTIKLYRAQTGL